MGTTPPRHVNEARVQVRRRVAQLYDDLAALCGWMESANVSLDHYKQAHRARASLAQLYHSLYDVPDAAEQVKVRR